MALAKLELDPLEGCDAGDPKEESDSAGLEHTVGVVSGPLGLPTEGGSRRCWASGCRSPTGACSPAAPSAPARSGSLWALLVRLLKGLRSLRCRRRRLPRKETQ